MLLSLASNSVALHEGALLEAAPAAKARVLLIEGFDDALCAEVGYVKQGAKVWVAFGESADLKQNLMESFGASTLLVESLDKLDLFEDANGVKHVKDGVWIVEGPSQRSDAENKNKRRYPRAIWEKLIDKQDSYVQQSIKARGMLGHLEHPKDGRTDGNLGALVVTESKLRPDGVVWNKYELLDTPAGKILQEYTKKKVRWGISSRGNGSVSDEGVVDPDDFILETWDGVMRPSTHGAYALPVAPAKGAKGVQENETITASSATKGADGVMTEAAKALTTQVESFGALDFTKTVQADRTALAARIEETLTKLTTATSEGEIPAVAAIPLSTRMGRFLAILDRAANPAMVAESVVLESGPRKLDKRGEAFDRVIGDLQKRVIGATTEATDLRFRITELSDQLGETVRERDDLKLDLATCATSLVEAEQKLTVARDTIVTVSEAQPLRDDVAGLVESLVSVHPALGEMKAFLNECASTTEVATQVAEYLAERVIPAELEPVVSMPAPVANRSTLPRGLVVESELTAPAKSEPAPELPPAVRLARAVLLRMHPVQSA